MPMHMGEKPMMPRAVDVTTPAGAVVESSTRWTSPSGSAQSVTKRAQVTGAGSDAKPEVDLEVNLHAYFWIFKRVL